jgi:LCP family protein required for cell wall assembly
MDDLAQLRNFRAGLAPPTGVVREHARRAWKDDVQPTMSHASRRLGVRFAVALATVTALVTVSIVVVNHLVDQRVAEIPRVALGKGTLQPVGAGDYPQNVLILGTDAPPQSPEVEGARSDTMILLRLRRHSAEAVWFPRSLLVQIPGQGGAGTLNSAYWLGGPQLAIDTLKANFNLDVNHYVELDMAGLREIVDAAGGIRVAFPEALRDEHSGLQVAAGCVKLDGAQTLALARSRGVEAFRDGAWQMVDIRSELDRDERQKELVGLLRTSVRDELVDHPLRLTRLVDAFLNHVKIDDSFDRQEVVRLARVLVGIDPARFDASVLPIAVAPTDLNRLAIADESSATLQRLGGFSAPSGLPAVTPGDPDGLRPC